MVNKADHRYVNPKMVEPVNRATFPELLVEFRTARGLSRSRLAKLVGLDPSYLTRVENWNGPDRRNPPSVAVIRGFARALELSPAETHRLIAAAGYWPWRHEWNERLERIANLIDVGDSKIDRLLDAAADVAEDTIGAGRPVMVAYHAAPKALPVMVSGGLARDVGPTNVWPWKKMTPTDWSREPGAAVHSGADPL